MADLTTSAAICLGAGAIAAPICAVFGFDPTLMISGLVGGFAGCATVQMLIPEKENQDIWPLVKVTLGSVLFAVILTLGFTPWIIKTFGLNEMPPGIVRFVFGAAIGTVAQPLLVIVRTTGIKGAKKFFGAFFDKGADNV